jgi:hypothetical protein
MSLLAILLPSVIPALTDGARAIIAKYTGSAGAQPQNVAEAIQLMEAQTKRVQALADLDKLPDGASQWVINLRGAFRYVVIGTVLSAAAVGVFVPNVPEGPLAMLLELAGGSMSFILGERMYLNMRGGAK